MIPYDNWFKGKNAKLRLYMGLFWLTVGGLLYFINWLFDLGLG